jgi:carboxymethylenebutenolidase
MYMDGLGIQPGAAHGWMKPDIPVYDRTAAARGWREMFLVFAGNLPTRS